LKPGLLLTFDSMRHANTGLHTFGHCLGREIMRQGADSFQVSAYTYPAQQGFLGADVGYVAHNRLHRLYFPRRRAFDIVHFADQYCRFGPAKVAGKTVMTVHDMNQIYEYPAGSAKIARYLRRMQAKVDGAHHIVAISQFVAADIVRHFPQARDKISVIYNGSDSTSAPAGHRPKHDPGGEFLFTVGMVCPKKNFHVLAPLLRNNSLKLVIAGIVKEEYRARIAAEAARHGVSERVMVTGPVSQFDKDWYYANCQAFLFPSLAEGFGLPVIEAMHHGKPVFLSTLTSLPEVGGDAAYYFTDFEPDNMARVFEQGMADFRAGNGVARVRANAARFTWERAGAEYLALYRSVLGAVHP
jgi:glycosyltransferase involved in cell wall biosynthesis